MISKNLQRGIIVLTKGHLQDLSHIFFKGKVLPPITPHATMNPISLSSSSKAGFPKLLVHHYPLDTVAGLHVPPKFCDDSLKKRLSIRISH